MTTVWCPWCSGSLASNGVSISAIILVCLACSEVSIYLKKSARYPELTHILLFQSASIDQSTYGHFFEFNISGVDGFGAGGVVKLENGGQASVLSSLGARGTDARWWIAAILIGLDLFLDARV